MCTEPLTFFKPSVFIPEKASPPGAPGSWPHRWRRRRWRACASARRARAARPSAQAPAAPAALALPMSPKRLPPTQGRHPCIMTYVKVCYIFVGTGFVSQALLKHCCGTPRQSHILQRRLLTQIGGLCMTLQYKDLHDSSSAKLNPKHASTTVASMWGRTCRRCCLCRAIMSTIAVLTH